ncbi:tyrosine-type recombinase/integrase [Hahella ganghwensis]|uniref:tyrosine-type recombinase/integrase n=1 Tax=Hahella ganghwensis TaxID=286420 RepID=UPI000477319D|nr:tyrosine-type recombinase/integrase [Hahella ganghwensis]
MNSVEAVKTRQEIERVEHLLRKHGGDLYGDLWRIGVNLALRISDLLELRYQDLTSNDIKIHEKKTGKSRLVRLNNTAQRLIEARKAKHPDHDYIFQVHSNRAKGKPISRETVARKFKEIGEIVGVQLGTHSMRKSRGWAMYSDGVPIEKIAMVLNHSTPAVTMRYLGITQEEVLQTYLEYEL